MLPVAFGALLLQPFAAVAQQGVESVTSFGASPGSASFHNQVAFKGELYFATTDDYDLGHGNELWKSDGTAAGTQLVKDINPGPAGSSISRVVCDEDLLFFSAHDGVHGLELWVSDGTTAGTRMVKDLNPGAPSTVLADLCMAGGKAFFRSHSSGVGLWVSDGTDEGTLQLTTQNPVFIYPVGDQAFFRMQFSSGLWKTDGTVEGTTMVKNLSNLPGNWPVGLPSLAVMGGKFYFTHNGGDGKGLELWVSDGTEAGTHLVADVYTGSSSSNISNLTAIGDMLYFSATTPGNAGVELWKSDGTQAGTTLVKDVRAGSGSSSPADFTAVGDTVYFTATDSISGKELWKTDGTTAGTALVKDIYTGSGYIGLYNSNPTDLLELGGKLYFIAASAETGSEIWESDGTAEGTVALDLVPGPGSSLPAELRVVGSEIYFNAVYLIKGRGLWKSDGTVAGTQWVADLSPREDNISKMGEMAWVGNRLYFAAPYPGEGTELWSSDGTAAGTQLLKAMNAYTISSDPKHFTPTGSGSSVYFTANTSGVELWMSDGTANGTQMVKDINSTNGSSSSNPANFTRYNSSLTFFTATTSAEGEELWRTDGTSIGTYSTVINPGTNSAAPAFLTLANSRLYFAATQNGNRSLWSMAVNVTPNQPASVLGTGSTNPEHITVMNGTVYFAGTASGTGRELWAGTHNSAAVLRDINPGTASSDPAGFFWWGGRLYFSAVTAGSGRELWYWDPTFQSLQQLAEINLDGASSNPRNFLDMGGYFLFTADTGSGNEELWRSDGTQVGTYQVREIRAGALGAGISELTPMGNVAVFRADDGVHGAELWVTNGTYAGTHLLADVNPGALPSNPTELCVDGTKLYFLGGTLSKGMQLFKLEDAASWKQLVVTTTGGDGVVTGAGTYYQGTEAQITASPAPGYLFSHWAGEGITDTSAASTTVLMDATKTVTAHFILDPVVELTVSAGPGGSASGAGSYENGTLASITATPNSGYAFLQWTGEGVTDSTAASTTVLMNRERSVSASFIQQKTLSVSSSGNGTVTGGGYVTPGETAIITATPNAGYAFYQWVGSGATHGFIPNTPVQMTEDRAFTAEFRPLSWMNDAVESNDGFFSFSGGSSWVLENAVSHQGGDSLRSAPLGQGHSTTLAMDIGGPGLLTFWWKMEGDGRLELWSSSYSATLNGNDDTIIRSGIEWRRVQIALTRDQRHIVTWQLTRTGSGSPTAYVDHITFEPQPELAPVLDSSSRGGRTRGLQNGETSGLVGGGFGAQPITHIWRLNPTAPGVGEIVATTQDLDVPPGSEVTRTYQYEGTNAIGTTFSEVSTVMFRDYLGALDLGAVWTNATFRTQAQEHPVFGYSMAQIYTGAEAADGVDALRIPVEENYIGRISLGMDTPSASGVLEYKWRIKGYAPGAQGVVDFYLRKLGSPFADSEVVQPLQAEPDGDTGWQTGYMEVPSGWVVSGSIQLERPAGAEPLELWLDQFVFRPAGEGAPLIYEQPRHYRADAGATVTLGVKAIGAGTLSYQWRRNSADIPGATSSTYTISNLQAGNSGKYSCVVTSSVGGNSVTSRVVNVSVAELGAALGYTELPWVAMDENWAITGMDAVTGGTSLRSVEAKDFWDQRGASRGTFTGPAVLGFWYRADGALGFLRVNVLGQGWTTLDAGDAWTWGTVTLPLGTHTVDFHSSGPSRMYLDGIEPGAVNYTSWKAQHFSLEEQGDDAISGKDVDLDGDGIANGLEAVFGGSPRSWTPPPFTTRVDTSTGSSRYTFSFVMAPLAPPDAWLSIYRGLEVGDGALAANRPANLSWEAQPGFQILEVPLPDGGKEIQLISDLVPGEDPQGFFWLERRD